MTFVDEQSMPPPDDILTQTLRTYCITQSEGRVFNVMKIGLHIPYTTADI
jgi:hypothetical protein